MSCIVCLVKYVGTAIQQYLTVFGELKLTKTNFPTSPVAQEAKCFEMFSGVTEVSGGFRASLIVDLRTSLQFKRFHDDACLAQKVLGTYN